MRLGVLGPLLVADYAGRQIHLPGRARVLMAALALRANQVVPAEELAELVFEGAASDRAQSTLRSYVWRLRTALGPGEAARIVSHPPGYLCRADESELDVLAFDTLCRQAREALSIRQWAQASEAAGRAVALWRGVPPLDVPSQALRDAYVSRLEQLRTQVLENQAEADLWLGRARAVRDELDWLIAPATAAAATGGTVVISTIDGMAGIGKTGLAIHAGHRLSAHFPDGQLFLDLHGYTQGHPLRAHPPASRVTRGRHRTGRPRRTRPRCPTRRPPGPGCAPSATTSRPRTPRRTASAGTSTPASALSQALEIYRAADYRSGEATALTELGIVKRLGGDVAGATDALSQALEIYRATGNRNNEAWALNHYAAAVAAAGDLPRARRLYLQALNMNRELGKPDDEAVSLEGLGECLLADGDTGCGSERDIERDTQRGSANLRQALEIFQRLGMRTDTERVTSHLDTIGL